jgi:hypothetical protein
VGCIVSIDDNRVAWWHALHYTSIRMDYLRFSMTILTLKICIPPQ